MNKCYTYWYDPATNLRHIVLKMSEGLQPEYLALIADKFVFAVGSNYETNSRSIEMLDLSSQSPCWVPMVDMLVSRSLLGVGILNNCIYAVSYINILLIVIIN